MSKHRLQILMLAALLALMLATLDGDIRSVGKEVSAAPLAVSVALTPTVDTWISEAIGSSDEAHPDTQTLAVGRDEFDQEYYALLRFDLSSIPSDASIVSAKFEAWHEATVIDPFPQTVCIFRIDSAWNAAVTGDTRPAIDTECQSSQTVGADFGIYTWTGLDELVAAWVDGSVANHGLALRITSAAIAHKAFQSREGNVKPQLIVEYLPQDTPSLTTGDTLCQYGQGDCNVCVQDVRAAYDALDTGRRDSHVFKFDPSVVGTDRIRLRQHIQGMARIPGLANDNWIVFSKHDRNEPHQAGLIFVEYPGINSDGDAWKHAERTSDRGNARHFFTNADTDHPGGMQITGQVLAVGMDCDSDPICRQRAWVDFYDLSQADHGDVTQLHRLVLDGSRGEAHQFPPGAVPSGEKASKAHYVSVVKLATGHFLLFVVGANDNRGWFYVTDSAGLSADTTWTYLEYWNTSHTVPSGRWSTYQNGNLITECSTGDIYFFGMREGVGRKNYLDLYRLERAEQFRFRWIDRKVVWNRVGGCTLRGGGSVHVTPDKDEIVLYCIEKNQRLGPNMTLEEFRNH